MRIAQITNTTNFNGIKNIGYARIINKQEPCTRAAMHMELTNDEKGNDLDHYRAFLQQRPEFINSIAPNDLTIEIATKPIQYGSMLMAQINGTPVPLDPKNKAVMEYMNYLTKRIVKMPEKNFVVDPDYAFTDQAQRGLMHGEPIDNYLDGTSGELDLLEGTGLIEKFDLYMNAIPSVAKEYEPETEFENEALEKELDEIDKITMKAMDDVISVLYEPAYVKYNSIFFDAIVQGYTDFYNPQTYLN